MADLGALQVLPPELHLLVLDFANLQTVCRFSQANRRARALVGGLFVGLDTVRSLLRSGPAVPRPARKLGNHVRVATSEVWTYGLLASTLCGRTGQTNNSPSPSYAGCGTCRRCADRSLSSLSVALLDPLVEERFHLVSKVFCQSVHVVSDDILFPRQRLTYRSS